MNLQIFQGCSGINPFFFLSNITEDISQHKRHVVQIGTAMSNYGISNLTKDCGVDARPLNASLNELLGELDIFEAQLNEAMNLTSCSSIQPIANDVLNGVPCTESIQGISWLFGGMLALTVLSLCILSTRAALYNPVIEPRRKKRREREFKEYKLYMAEFYDTTDWKMDPPKKLNCGGNIHSATTFDTEENSSKASSKDSDHGSPRSCDHHIASENSTEHHVPFSFDESIDAHYVSREVTSPSPGMIKTDESPTPTSVTSRLSIVASVAASVMVNGLEIFRQKDPEVEYYSSDSEDEDDNNDTSVRAHVSDLIHRVTCRETPLQRDLGSASKNASLRRVARGPERLTPRKRQYAVPAPYIRKYMQGQPRRHESSPESSFPHDEVDDLDSSSSSPEQLPPATPDKQCATVIRFPLDEKGNFPPSTPPAKVTVTNNRFGRVEDNAKFLSKAPPKPSKSRKALVRTLGGANLKE
ncbi:MAG: hypothetical protein JRN15_18910 [Nitrososphaerota archaeon]|nr:hypothetical protein [Nitrososphaerota archaeon]